MSKKKEADAIPHDGIQAVAEMFQVMDPSHQQRLMKELEKKDPKMFTKIKGRMFSFLDLINLDPKSFQILFQAIPLKKWALAMRGMSDQNKSLLLKNISSRSRTNLEEEIEDLGPQKITDVNEARIEIIDFAKKLELEKKIQLNSNSGEFV